MTEITWGGPPPAKMFGQRSAYWDNVADELRARPGQWGLVHRGRASVATSIKNAQVAAFRPAGSFTAVSRHVEPGEEGHDIYARYIGENGEYGDD